MHRLGFEKFYIQGGDWGAVITANMAALFPEKLVIIVIEIFKRNDMLCIWLFQDNWFTLKHV